MSLWSQIRDRIKSGPDPAPTVDDPAHVEVALDRLEQMFKEAGIEYFTPAELCMLPKAKPAPRIELPPESMWPDLIAVALVADAVRREYGRPLSVSSGYRPRWYNTAVGGAKKSAHIHAGAVDLNVLVRHRSHGLELERAAATIWLNDPTIRGLGVYRGYRVHVDVIGRRRRWGPHWRRAIRSAQQHAKEAPDGN